MDSSISFLHCISGVLTVSTRRYGSRPRSRLRLRLRSRLRFCTSDSLAVRFFSFHLVRNIQGALASHLSGHMEYGVAKQKKEMVRDDTEVQE